MAFSFTILAGQSGLTKSSFDFRIWDGVTAIADNGFTVTELGSTTEYAVEGLPDSAGAEYTLTWQLGAVGGAKRWPELEATAREYVIIPYRTTGLSAGSFGLELFKDNADDASSLTLTEIGSPGDYAVSGWSLTDAGSWMLRWKISAFFYFEEWTIVAGVSGWEALRDVINARIDRAFAFALAEDATLVTRKGLQNKKVWSPSADDNAVRGYYKYATTDRKGASSGFDRTSGTVFLQIMVKQEIGDDLVVQLADAMKPAFITESDGLEFEQAPKLLDAGDAGYHFIGVASFPFHQDRVA